MTLNYDRAREVLETDKGALTRIAEALLIRKVFDADQVKQIAKGLPLEDPVAAEAPQTPADGETDHPDARPTIARTVAR